MSDFKTIEEYYAFARGRNDGLDAVYRFANSMKDSDGRVRAELIEVFCKGGIIYDLEY